MDDPATAHRGARIETELASLAQGGLLVDRAGCILDANAAARRLFVDTRNSLHGRSLVELIPALTPETLATLFEQPRSRRRKLRGVRCDAAVVLLSVAISRVRTEQASALLLTIRRARRRQSVIHNAHSSFLQLAQALPQILWTWTAEGAVDFLAPSWLEFTGVPFDAQRGDGWLAWVHDEDRPAVDAARRQAIAEARMFKAEFRARRHDGEYHWFEATMVPLSSRAAAVARWGGTLSNIHEARTNRMALIAERDRFAQLVSSVPGAVYAFRRGPDDSISFPLSSENIDDYFGVPPEVLAQGDPAAAPRIHPEDFPRLEATSRESGRLLTPWFFEWRLLHPQRGERWMEGRAMPLREKDGGTIWYGIAMDVTQRKHAEEALRRSQARLQAAVMASGIGTYIWDVATGRLWWDDVLLKMFDRTREEVESDRIDTLANFVLPEDRAVLANAMLPVWQGDSDTLNVEHRALRHDGALQWIGVSGRAERDTNGKLIRLTCACTDITARKRAEEVQRSSQKIEALGTLAGGIAHDFNNLLLAIAGNTHLAMADLPSDHVVQRNLNEIDKAGTRATDLVRRILSFGHQSEPRRAIIDLRATVEEALRLLRATLPAMIAIRPTFSDPAPAVDADATQMHQIVMNLVTNAAYAIGDHAGLISIDVDSVTIEPGDAQAPADVLPGAYARIRVTDTGVGMDKATLERIFDPFFTTKPLGQGTGLGLSVVHGIAHAHQGGIAALSEPGQGATFDVYLPVVVRAIEIRSAAPQAAGQGHGQRVMYVDDEEALVFLVVRVLERTGYVVSGFCDAREALQAFQREPQRYDVVVTDLSMPGMSGFALARELLAIRPQVPVLMTSGYVRPQDREMAAQLGIREVILKPDTVDELGHALEKLFRQYRSS